MKNLIGKYEACFKDKKFITSVFTALIFLGMSIVVNYFAAEYVAERASNSVTDIVLSNIPVFDVDVPFVYGGLFLIIFTTLLCVYEPKKMPFIVKTISLFIITRSFFITLTHIGPFPTHAFINHSGIVGLFTTGSDLFFSGHTGMPYLMALIFWQHKILRSFFLLLAGFFGVIVLMGHLHYSIDVASAFFITYTIFHIADVLFKKDKVAFFKGPRVQDEAH
jgi:hypothetical protein